MPSISAHMVVAKLVGEKLGIDSEDFIRGNLLPDIINIDDSHHKIEGKYFLIPDIDYFKTKLDLNNKLYLGYYTHLLLDKYFLEEYVPNYTKSVDCFSNGIIYIDYDLVNYRLVKEYDLDVKYLSEVLKHYEQDINKEVLNNNIKFLNSTNDGEPNCLDYDGLCKFLNEISERIYKEIKK